MHDLGRFGGRGIEQLPLKILQTANAKKREIDGFALGEVRLIDQTLDEMRLAASPFPFDQNCEFGIVWGVYPFGKEMPNLVSG
jgi:hypothetical protein